MSQLSKPTQVFYFASVLKTKNFEESSLIQYFSSQSLVISKEFTPSFNPLFNYYSKEMGEKLERKIFFFEKSLERDLLVDFKISSDKFEQLNSLEGKRKVNIDFGYIALEQMILATGKPYGHRIYLGRKVYAELTYVFSGGEFNPLPWTYPDYAHDEKRSFFSQIRRGLLEK